MDCIGTGRKIALSISITNRYSVFPTIREKIMPYGLSPVDCRKFDRLTFKEAERLKNEQKFSDVRIPKIPEPCPIVGMPAGHPLK